MHRKLLKMTTIRTVIYNSPSEPISHTSTTDQEILVRFGHNETFSSSIVFLYADISGNFSGKQLSNTRLLLRKQLEDAGVNIEGIAGERMRYTITAETASLGILRTAIKLKNFYESDIIQY